jgi:hypothetical protein
MEGNTLHTYTYEGGVTGAMMGVKDSFIPEKNYTDVVLMATLTKDGEVVEEVSVTYSCTDIDASLCEGDDMVAVEAQTSLIPLAVVTVIALLVLLFLIRFMRSHHAPKDEVVMKMPTNE